MAGLKGKHMAAKKKAAVKSAKTVVKAKKGLKAVRIIHGKAVAKTTKADPGKQALALHKLAEKMARAGRATLTRAAKVEARAAKAALRALKTRAESYSEKTRGTLESIALPLFPESAGAVIETKRKKCRTSPKMQAELASMSRAMLVVETAEQVAENEA